MPSQISVSFRVSGNELASYIDQIQKKSDQLSQSAIKSAIEQAEKGKEIIGITNAQIKALENKNRLETQASRSLLLEHKENLLRQNNSVFEGRKNDVFSDTFLSEKAKKEKITALEGSQKAGEEKIKNDYKEELQTLREQECQTKLQVQLAKENLDAIKQTARENVKAIMQGDTKLADVIDNAKSDEEKLVSRLTEEGVAREKKSENSERKESVLGSILGADSIMKVISTGGQFAQTQNGFDLIKPASDTAGRVIGGIIGGIIGTLVEPGGGTMVGAGLGSQIGGAFGDVIGELESRKAQAQQEYFRARGRYNAVTGNYGDIESNNFEGIGITATQTLQLQSEYARKRGSSSTAGTTLRDALYAEKGLGVDQNTSSALIEMQRSAKSNNRELASLIGGILDKGKNDLFKNGDTTFLNEFLNKFSSLQRELLKSQSTVPTGATMDILQRFNRVGNEFAASDPRSQGLTSTINNSLVNPNTDFKKSLAFYALRKDHPNMGLADLIEEQQRGISSPKYLRSMMGLVNGMGGDDDAKRINFAGLLGLEGNQKAATDIFRGFQKGIFDKDISHGELAKIFPDLQKRAEGNAPDIDKNFANIQNSLLQGAFQSMSAMKDAFSNAIRDSLGNAVIELNNGQGKIILKGHLSAPMKTNSGKTNNDSSNYDPRTGEHFIQSDPYAN